MPILRPRKSYGVCVCVSLRVIKSYSRVSTPTGGRSWTKKKFKKSDPGFPSLRTLAALAVAVGAENCNFDVKIKDP